MIAGAYCALLILPFAWGWALWMAHNSGANYDISVSGVHFPGPLLVAIAIYLIGMVFNELKERV